MGRSIQNNTELNSYLKGSIRNICSQRLNSKKNNPRNILGYNNATSWIPPPLSQNLYTQVRFRSNRSRRGLYDGKDIRTGNNVSFSNRKTKRKFKPNVFKKRVYSETLDEMIRFHLTASTLRSIDKAGGLDNYLLKTKHIGEGEGVVAKRRVLKEKKKQERERERKIELEKLNMEVDV